MDKYEYRVRVNEIEELIRQGAYAEAAEIADTIDWRRVKSVMMLCKVSDLYKMNRRYEDARDMLLLAYERRPGGRSICYSLCELSIKMEEYVQAIEYYKEYVQAVSSPMSLLANAAEELTLPWIPVVMCCSTSCMKHRM